MPVPFWNMFSFNPFYFWIYDQLYYCFDEPVWTDVPLVRKKVPLFLLKRLSTSPVSFPTLRSTQRPGLILTCDLEKTSTIRGRTRGRGMSTAFPPWRKDVSLACSRMIPGSGELKKAGTKRGHPGSGCCGLRSVISKVLCRKEQGRVFVI